jgi:hypothetical protein
MLDPVARTLTTCGGSAQNSFSFQDSDSFLGTSWNLLGTDETYPVETGYSAILQSRDVTHWGTFRLSPPEPLSDAFLSTELRIKS